MGQNWRKGEKMEREMAREGGGGTQAAKKENKGNRGRFGEGRGFLAQFIYITYDIHAI